MTDALRDQIRAFILENYLFTDDKSALGLDDSLLERGIVDSTGMLEIIFFIEEQLGVKVKDEEMIPDNLDGVNKIAAIVFPITAFVAAGFGTFKDCGVPCPNAAQRDARTTAAAMIMR